MVIKCIAYQLHYFHTPTNFVENFIISMKEKKTVIDMDRNERIRSIEKEQLQTNATAHLNSRTKFKENDPIEHISRSWFTDSVVRETIPDFTQAIVQAIIFTTCFYSERIIEVTQ
jgi:hypothetical protein